MINKNHIASELRDAIQYYTDLTVTEHATGEIDKEANRAWKQIEKLINQLSGA